MDVWIKIFVVMIMFSALSMVMTYFLISPIIGLILLSVILTLLVITMEPATGKAMAQLTVPLVVILFIIEIFWMRATIVFDTWMLLVIGFVLYIMFMMFTGGSSLVEGGFIDAKISLKLFPIYGVAIFLSMLIDPTNQLTALIMGVTVLGMMALSFIFLRDYSDWPAYTQFKYPDIRAVSDINPKGKVKTGAEIWWARTSGPPIKSGEKVVILSITGMTMIVARPDDVISGQDH